MLYIDNPRELTTRIVLIVVQNISSERSKGERESGKKEDYSLLILQKINKEREREILGYVLKLH